MYKVDFTLSWKQMPIKLRAYEADRSCAQPKKRSKYWYISLLVPMVLERRSIWNSQISLSLHHQSWQLQQTYSTAHWLNSGLKDGDFSTFERSISDYFLSHYSLCDVCAKEIQIILRLFLICHLLLQTKSVPSQPASNVGG